MFRNVPAKPDYSLCFACSRISRIKPVATGNKLELPWTSDLEGGWKRSACGGAPRQQEHRQRRYQQQRGFHWRPLGSDIEGSISRLGERPFAAVRRLAATTPIAIPAERRSAPRRD